MRPGVRRLLACWLLLLATTAPAGAQNTQQPFPGDRLAYVSGGKLYVGFPHPHLVPDPGNAF